MSSRRAHIRNTQAAHPGNGGTVSCCGASWRMKGFAFTPSNGGTSITGSGGVTPCSTDDSKIFELLRLSPDAGEDLGIPVVSILQLLFEAGATPDNG